jgi:alginate O-acetyltransferase complex protein AlgI
MVFSSPTFLFVFLPIVLIGYVALPHRWRNVWLLLASGFFYLWGAGDQIGVILFVTLTSFAGARAVVARKARTGRTPRVLACAVLLALLAPLFVVKYLPQLPGSPLRFVLPLGISFFTFHAISFLIDVLRGRIPPETSLRDYLLYIFIFPHQIAGPIVRYSEIREEIKARRRLVDTSQAAYGVTRFAWGLAKKACVADPCGMVADFVFAQPSNELTTPMAWLGALAYAVQIYFDFSGYSDMAIGLAALFGFRFPENFNAPYRAASVTEFWRRWHMTLSRWFRDYVYIPLGGSRHGPRREFAALLVTFLATSLWHGATPGFLVWGGLHSLALIVERVTGLRHAQRWQAARRLLTGLFVVLAWVPFRAQTMGEALTVWRAMFAGAAGSGFGGLTPDLLVTLGPLPVVAMVVGLAAFAGPRDARWLSTWFRFRAISVFAAPALLTASVAAVFWLDFSPFLYFRF